MPQLQTAALPRPQEEEETDKSKQAQTEQMYEKHQAQSNISSHFEPTSLKLGAGGILATSLVGGWGYKNVCI